MSAFLGPIHFWLYHKVQLQEQLTETLLAAFPAQQGQLKTTLDEKYGVLPTGNLADIINETNIHGWLQEQVDRAEKRLAHTVSSLAVDRKSKQKLIDAAFQAGQEAKLSTSTPEETFKALQDVLLDGMPCDHVNALRFSDTDSVQWERVNDLHSNYYTNIGADPSLFDTIRDAWVNGMLGGTQFRYQRDGCIFSLIKES